jgi:hypothetical protein
MRTLIETASLPIGVMMIAAVVGLVVAALEPYLF